MVLPLHFLFLGRSWEMAIKADVHVPFGSVEGTIQAGKVTATELASSAVTTAKIADDAVTKAKVGEQLVKAALIAGGAAGNHTVTGIATADNLVMVLHYTTGAALANLTSEFTITGANTINNGGGTDTTSDQLVVIYQDNS